MSNTTQTFCPLERKFSTFLATDWNIKTDEKIETVELMTFHEYL
jgi:hypothetical protein